MVSFALKNSINQFSTQLYPVHILNVERYVGWGCVLNCFMLSPLPGFPAFADLLSPYLVTILMLFFFNLAYITLNFAIYHRAASLSSQLPQSMYAVLAEESLTRLCSNTESTMDDKDSACIHAHQPYF